LIAVECCFRRPVFGPTESVLKRRQRNLQLFRDIFKRDTPLMFVAPELSGSFQGLALLIREFTLRSGSVCFELSVG
jgi:hypothetical protein